MARAVSTGADERAARSNRARQRIAGLVEREGAAVMIAADAVKA